MRYRVTILSGNEKDLGLNNIIMYSAKGYDIIDQCFQLLKDKGIKVDWPIISFRRIE